MIKNKFCDEVRAAYAKAKQQGESHAVTCWRNIPLHTRKAITTIAGCEHLHSKKWDELPIENQQEIGSIARELARGLSKTADHLR